MFRGEGESEDAWPEEAPLLSDGCKAASGSRSNVETGGDGSVGEGIEHGDVGEVVKDGGSAWIVIAGQKE